MLSNAIQKSVTLAIHSTTFGELEILSTQNNETLAKIYLEAVENYLADCTPARLKVFAAPGAGKRIRVNLENELYCKLVEKSSASGHNLNDIIYTAIEYLLNKDLRALAA